MLEWNGGILFFLLYGSIALIFIIYHVIGFFEKRKKKNNGE